MSTKNPLFEGQLARRPSVAVGGLSGVGVGQAFGYLGTSLTLSDFSQSRPLEVLEGTSLLPMQQRASPSEALPKVVQESSGGAERASSAVPAEGSVSNSSGQSSDFRVGTSPAPILRSHTTESPM